MFASAWARGAASGDGAVSLLAIHRSLGVTIVAVTAARLVWRARFASTPELPKETPKLQRLIARAVEYGLYGLLIAQPLAGLADTLFRGRPFQLFVWRAPALFARDKLLAHSFNRIHELMAFILLMLIAAHTVAALFHRYVRRDEVLQSILPWTRRSRAVS